MYTGTAGTQGTGVDVASEVPESDEAKLADIRFPRQKGEAQKLLRKFGLHGYKIESIEDPRIEPDTGVPSARVYVLTGPVLQEDGEMRRAAKTVVFRFTPEEVIASELEGWDVG